MVSGQGTLKTGSLGGAIYLDYVNKTQSKTRDISNFIIANSSSCTTPNSKIDLQNNCVIEESDEDGDSDDSLNGMSGDYNTPDFQEKMEYVLRLGYTVDQFKTVWKRLGPEAKENNVLLAELLKLTQNSSMKSVNENSLEMEHNLSLNTESAASVSEKSSLSKDTINRNPDDSDNLRMIVIDGSNVAMLHGNKEVFSCKGIKYAVDYFKKRGHKKIVVFVPQWRKEAPRKDAPIIDQEILTELEKERILIFTPARTIKGKRVACYDDRYILNLADDKNAIVVSNDNYRDLLNENNGFKKVVEERLLMYSFFEDKFMPPDDPLGRHGPSLDNFLRKTPTAPETLPPNCPYGKKCTYGNKCKFYHPERGNMPHKTVTEKLAEQYKQQEKVLEAEKNKMQLKSKGKNPLSRSRSRYADGGEVPQLTAEEQEQKQRLAKEYNEKLDRSRKEITRLTEQEKAAANKTISNVDGIAAHLSQFSLSNLDSGNQGNKAVHFERYNSSSLDKFNKSPNQQQELATCDRSDVNRTHSLPAQIQSENFVSGHLQLAKSLSGEEIEAKKKSQIFPQSSPHHTPLCRQSSVYVDSEHHNKANTAMKHNLPTPNHVRQDVLSNLFSNNQGDSIFIYETMSPSYSYPPPCESFNFPPTPFPYAVSEKMILGQVYTPNITRHFSLPNTWGHDCYSPSYQIQAPDNGQKGFYETIPSSPSCLSPVYTCPVTSSNNVSLPSYVRTQQFKMPSPPRQHYSTYATTQQQSLPLQPPPPPPPPQQQQQPPQLNPVMSSVMSTASWPLDNTSYSDMLVHPTMSNTPQGQKMNIYYNSGQ